MTLEAQYVRPRHEARLTLAAAIQTGEVYQIADGRAAVFNAADGLDAGERAALKTDGQYVVAKKTGEAWISGGPLWWDRSASVATCVPPLEAGDRDFFIGCAVGDAASGDATGTANLNVTPSYIIDYHRDGGDTAVVLTAGTPYVYSRGGSLEAGFSATAEAQKLDWMSKRSFPVDSNWVLEGVLDVVTNADAAVADLNLGVANGTHASDFQSIAELAAFHYSMGTDANIDVTSDDGTTDVNDTDSTVDWAAGTPVYFCIDGRDPANLKFYINGVRVASGTTFTLAAATGPLKAIFHLEKSANDSPGVVQLDALRVRLAEQD